LEWLVPVVGIPALVTGGWTFVGLHLMGSSRAAVGALVAAGISALLMITAAFLPLVGPVGALAVPLLCIAGAYLLMRLFARTYAVALALSGALAIVIGLRPALFPFLLPLALVVPLWMVGWVESERNTGRFVLVLLAAFIAVPAAVFGLFFLARA
jgi:hypothetical protein